jgi:hypothetical protein
MGCSVPSKRNLLDKASAAQSLDGDRLTGSLLVPGARLYSPDYPLTSESNVRFVSLANVEMSSLDVGFTSQKRTLIESIDTYVSKTRLVYCDCAAVSLQPAFSCFLVERTRPAGAAKNSSWRVSSFACVTSHSRKATSFGRFALALGQTIQ